MQLQQFFEHRRQKHEIAGNMLRRFKQAKRKSDHAKADANAAVDMLRRQKRALAAENEKQHQTDAALKALKYFDPAMLGQGQPNGGTAHHLKQRMEYMNRVKGSYPALTALHENNWPEFQKRLDQLNCRDIGIEGNAYGAWLANQMKTLINKLQEGHVSAFDKWIDAQLERLPEIFGFHQGA